ncbi:dihydrofolate reductase [Kribbella amoyensis]|uniref:Dihydrofolate reductase n=1 Tax=Kribbella amoyensis TaxID=996641 RepID=A0A561BP09_9ACTN|nr:dihydrofolate reductase family protein [Kribbella amoyensis]TWD80609.1 dihydrofolate reductase [Kribbella amoyensis]
MSERKVFANMTVSLDGRITGPGGLGDMAPIVPHAITDQSRDSLIRLTQRSSTALLGRGNYEGFGGFWPTVIDMADADPRDREFAKYLDDVEKVVFSHTLTETPWNNSRLATASLVDTVRELRTQEGGDIWVMSSKDLLAQLLAEDEIDRLEIQVAPEIVGNGIRYFEDGLNPSSWTLTDVITSDSGAIWTTYDHKK